MAQDFSAYDAFLKEVDGTGKQTFQVVDVSEGVFPNSGDPYTKVSGVLVSAGSIKVNLTLGSLPDIADKDAWDASKRRAVAQTINMYKDLAKIGKTPADIVPGDELLVEVVKNKEGFHRIVKVLGVPGAGVSKRSDDSDIPL